MSNIVKLLLIMVLSCITLTARAEKTILILGDSLSAAHNIPLGASWPRLLQKKLADKNYPYKVINASQSGDTTSNGLNRLPRLLEKYQPEIVLLALGGNDGLQGKQPALIKTNLQKMINMIQAIKATPVLVGIRLPPNYGQDYALAFINIYGDLAKANHIPLVPSLMHGIEENDKNFQTDRIHPIETVQSILMNNVWRILAPLLNRK